MRRAAFILLAITFVPTLNYAKDKAKPTLPPYVLRARTVAVIIDPDSGVDLSDPQANRVAQKDVETALLDWGRFTPQVGTAAADLIVVVRRGHKQLANDTITDPQQNHRAGVVRPVDDGVMIGGQHGQQPQISDASVGQTSGGTPHPQAEIASSDDTFVVFEGKVEAPLDGIPAWRWTAKDALHPHSVPAVAAFRKAVAEADKAAAKKP
jgi:hypothetical protein